ncbi:MAG: hypothetical protein JSV97_03950 [candidate division WOR-3 bacterium]|nr:MAG: hypothetical protein JSV97_03950 [candidate division WOR-3 bacterium]
MISLVLYFIFFSTNITPQNVFWDHYTLIPPLGEIKSIVASPFSLFAISDNYLLFLNKQPLSLEKTIYFDRAIELLGYDKWYDDLWITQNSTIIRLTIVSYSIREYEIPAGVDKIGISQDYVYLVSSKSYSLDKRTGDIAIVNAFPNDVMWYRKTRGSDLRDYTFLSPYYYYDEPKESQTPFYQFPITALYDDGMYLYVGTRQFGILQYNKVSWQKQRLIYGPVDSRIEKIRKLNNTVYFISPSGISYFASGGRQWRYHRFAREVADILPLKNYFVMSFENRLSRFDGGMVFSISNFPTDVISLSQDEENLYVGTKTGLFKIIKETDIPLPFGPDRYAVHAIYPTENAVYVGDDFAFYSYDRGEDSWLKVLNFGIKDIVELKNDLYLLGVNNQLIKYRTSEGDAIGADSNWILLPYFNVYDIDSDGEVLYCASYAGIYYYEPETELYKVIYNLPRIRYDYIFVMDDTLVTLSNGVIYSLPLEYRD